MSTCATPLYYLFVLTLCPISKMTQRPCSLCLWSLSFFSQPPPLIGGSYPHHQSPNNHDCRPAQRLWWQSYQGFFIPARKPKSFFEEQHSEQISALGATQSALGATQSVLGADLSARSNSTSTRNNSISTQSNLISTRSCLISTQCSYQHSEYLNRHSVLLSVCLRFPCYETPVSLLRVQRY